MSTKHTPLPWRASNNTGPTMQGYSQSSCVTGTGTHRGQIVAGCFNDIGGEDVAAANAGLIARACSAHDALVNALTLLSEKVYSRGGALAFTDELLHAAHALALARGAA